MMLRSVALLVAAVDCVVAAGALMLVTLRCIGACVCRAGCVRGCAGLAGDPWRVPTIGRGGPHRGMIGSAAYLKADRRLAKIILGSHHPSPTSGHLRGTRGQLIAASPKAEVAGDHSVNADEQRDKPKRPENILGHRFLLNRPLTEQCRRQCALSAAKCHARFRALGKVPTPNPLQWTLGASRARQLPGGSIV